METVLWFCDPQTLEKTSLTVFHWLVLPLPFPSLVSEPP